MAILKKIVEENEKFLSKKEELNSFDVRLTMDGDSVIKEWLHSCSGTGTNIRKKWIFACKLSVEGDEVVYYDSFCPEGQFVGKIYSPGIDEEIRSILSF